MLLKIDSFPVEFGAGFGSSLAAKGKKIHIRSNMRWSRCGKQVFMAVWDCWDMDRLCKVCLGSHLAARRRVHAYYLADPNFIEWRRA